MMATRFLGRGLGSAALRYVSASRSLVAVVAAKESSAYLGSIAVQSHARPYGSKSAAATSSSSSSKSSGDGGLLKVLKAEIAYEKGEESEPQDVKLQPPQPFTLHDKPGTQEVILRRSHNSEDIAITCLFRLSPVDEPIEEEEEDEEADEPVSQEEVHMMVTISKGADEPVLEISCTCTQGEIDIEKVSYVESGAAKDEMAYTGPEFSELDEDVQKQFTKYMDVRGINEDLCNFLINYMPEKERKEYIRWLEKVEKFVKK